MVLHRPVELAAFLGMYGPPQSCKRETLEVLKFAEEEEIGKAFENEKDLRDEIETALGKESEARAATEPTMRAKLLKWTAEKAAGTGAGLGTEWGMKAAEKLGEALLEPTRDVLKEMFSGHTGLESSPTWPILQKSLEELNRMDSAVDKLRALPSISKTALKPAEKTSLLLKVKKTAIDKAAQKTSNENLAKMALKFVTDKSIESLEVFLRKRKLPRGQITSLPIVPNKPSVSCSWRPPRLIGLRRSSMDRFWKWKTNSWNKVKIMDNSR